MRHGRDLGENKGMDPALAGPLYVPVALVMFVLAYWVLVIIGAAGLDMFEFDLDADADVDVDVGGPIAAGASWGLLFLRFLNLGGVPVMIWLTVFSISFFAISYVWNAPEFSESTWTIAQVVVKNAVLGLVATKILTQPLVGKFASKQSTKSASLIGQTCIIVSYQADEESGQASVKSDGAPFFVHVRTAGETLSKGDVAVIEDYQSDGSLFLVSRAATDGESEENES